MLSLTSIPEEMPQEFFSLSLRIEKATQIHVAKESAHIEIRHVQNQRSTQVEEGKYTGTVKMEHAVWMEDFYFSQVHSSDEFVVCLADGKGVQIASNTLEMDQFASYLNTGEQIKHTFELLSPGDDKVIVKIIIVMVLFEMKDPFAGIFLPNLSMNVDNQDWQKQEPQIDVSNENTNCNGTWCCLKKSNEVQGFTSSQHTTEELKKK